MHGRTDLPCHAGIVQASTSVQHCYSTIARLSLLLTHPTCGAGECAYGRFSIAVHMCVQTQYDARSIRRAACQTDRPSGVLREHDGHAVYSVHVYRHFLDALLHGAIHGYKISVLYTI